MSDKFEAAGPGLTRPLRRRIDTNELDFHAWWTVNGRASFKTLSGTLWIVIRSGEGQRQREGAAEFGLWV